MTDESKSRNDEESLDRMFSALWKAYEANCAGLDDLGHFMRLHHDRIWKALSAKSETERDAKDAARYRSIREHGIPCSQADDCGSCTGDELDTQIDDAIAHPENKQQSIPTPRTEHAAFRSRYADHVPTDVARQLERQLHVAVKALKFNRAQRWCRILLHQIKEMK